jgi:hypothetical protein
MSRDEKRHLLERMTTTHAELRTLLEDVDLELRIYADTNWRIRDILGHIATWDREVTKSLHAFMVGSEYVIPGMVGDETDFNEQAVVEQRKLSTQQILAEWDEAREAFKAALHNIPADRLPGDLLFPWGDERGSIPKMVTYMIEHDEEHGAEIAQVIQALQAD